MASRRTMHKAKQSYDWILNIDADEEVSPALARKIQSGHGGRRNPEARQGLFTFREKLSISAMDPVWRLVSQLSRPPRRSPRGGLERAAGSRSAPSTRRSPSPARAARSLLVQQHSRSDPHQSALLASRIAGACAPRDAPGASPSCWSSRLASSLRRISSKEAFWTGFPDLLSP